MKYLRGFKLTKRFFVGYVLFIVIALACMCISSVVISLNESQAYVTKLTKEQPKLDYSSQYGIIATDGVTSDDVIIADAFIKCLPANVQQYITSSNISIILVSNYEMLDVLSAEHNGDAQAFLEKDSDIHVTGTTEPHFNKPVIHIYADKVGNTFLHEIGHAIDYTTNGNYLFKESNRKAFKEIYTEEAGLWVPFGENVDGYAASNVEEYFAESFQQYILYPEFMQESAPKTYQYMETFVTEL